MKLIDKDALVAEIERLQECNRKICAGDIGFLKKSYPEHYYSIEIYNDILSFLDTLELKEVDLEKHLKEDIEDVFFDLDGVAVKGATHYLTVEDVKDIAKHFFELGMTASDKAQKGE